MDVNYINPFLKSTANVFQTMLGCAIERQGLSLKNDRAPTYDVTAVIGLSGSVRGSVVFSVSRAVAFQVVERMLGAETREINAEVVDAIGELTNMIAGGAKAEFAEYRLSLGLPNVIVGRNHSIFFADNVTPLCISFRTPWGPISLEVGLDFRAAPADQPVGATCSAEPAIAG